MIDYFNIPPQASIHAPITKKQFGEKATLSVTEKRILKEEITTITMRGLLQTRTSGIEEYIDKEYCYNQIIFAEVEIKNEAKAASVAAMIQKAFPAPMFVVIHCRDYYSVNWCEKRINQTDHSKRVIEKQEITRFFSIEDEEQIVKQWLNSLDITKIACATLKELYDELSAKLLMLQTAQEAGRFIVADAQAIYGYRAILEHLKTNREEQKSLLAQIKVETQFNARLKLTCQLKELQIKENELKNKI